MGHSRFELTEVQVTFDPARLPDLAAAALRKGYLGDLVPDERDAADLSPGRYELEELLREFFPDYHELSEDLDLSAEVTWYDGAHFPSTDAWEIFAEAAVPGSFITVLDFDDYTRDIDRVVFDGAGKFHIVHIISDGVPAGDVSGWA